MERIFHLNISDAELVPVATEFIASGAAFFRGGQSHGPLKRCAVPAAIEHYCCEHVDAIARVVFSWSQASTHDARRSAVRNAFMALRCAGPVFGGRNYWEKRFVEVLLLAGIGTGLDLDFAFDVWPVPSGTAAALIRVFPAARTMSQKREALRVLQRCMGGGTRRVTLVRLSAFLV